MDNPPDAASSTPSPYPLISASNYLTVPPVETEFDSKGGSRARDADFATGQNSAVFTDETRAFWVAPRPKDNSGVVYDELSETDKKNSTHPDSRKSTTC